MRSRRPFFAALGFAATLVAAPALAADPVVFAAASLKNALDEVAASYTASTGKKVTISYAVTFTDASGTTTVVASDKATVTVNPNQTVSRSFALTIKNGMAAGIYVVTITSSDSTGSVTQSSSFAVS